jgi:hypothetical protein
LAIIRIVRLVTDEGLCGYGAAESYKPYLKPHVLYYKPFVVGLDPTQVERVMLNIRHRGAFKPWGCAASKPSPVRRSYSCRRVAQSSVIVLLSVLVEDLAQLSTIRVSHAHRMSVGRDYRVAGGSRSARTALQ